MRLTLIILLIITGCQFKGEEVSRRRVKLGGWPFRPTQMRVHPFTTLTVENASGLLEVRVELLDPQGDVTKGVGDFRFELYSEQVSEPRTGHEKRIYQWTASIVGLEKNSEHWDPVTRTYRFVLKLESRPIEDQNLVLHAQFDTPSGERLTAQAPIETD